MHSIPIMCTIWRGEGSGEIWTMMRNNLVWKLRKKRKNAVFYHKNTIERGKRPPWRPKKWIYSARCSMCTLGTRIYKIYFLGGSGTQGSQCVEKRNIYLFKPAVGMVNTMGNAIWQTCCLSEASSFFALKMPWRFARTHWVHSKNSKIAKFPEFFACTL